MAGGVAALGFAVAALLLWGGNSAFASSSPITLEGGTASCPVAVTCTYSAVTSAVATGLSNTAGITWTLDISGLPTTGLAVTNASMSTDSTALSMTVDGTLALPSGNVPVQLSAVWSTSHSTTPSLAVAVQPGAGALSVLNPAWTSAIDPATTNAVLVTSPSTGTLTVSDLPSAGQSFYPASMTSLAVGPGLSLYAGVDTSTAVPALANALSYLGLGSTVSVSGTLSDNLDPLLSPATAASGLDLTISSTGTGSFPAWVTARSASLEFTDPSTGPVVTLSDNLTTSINGAANTFVGTATVSPGSFGGADVAITYNVSGSGFNAPFGLSPLQLSGTTLHVDFSTGASPSVAASLQTTATVDSTPLVLTASLEVSGGTVTGTFSIAGSVTLPAAVDLANSLLGTSAALPTGSLGAGVTLNSVTFSFGAQQFALSASSTLDSTAAGVLIAIDDSSGTPKLFAGLHMGNVGLSSLIAGTTDASATSGLSFSSLDVFASSGYLTGGQSTSVPWADLLPAEQTFFEQVYPGSTPPASVSFGPTLSVAGQLTLPTVVTDTFGISAPVTFSGDLGFGLDSVGTSPPPALGGKLTATLPALTAGLPSWLSATAPATVTLAADSSGDVSLSVSESATATISGTAHQVSISGAFTRTATDTSAALSGKLSGTFTGLFGASWLSVSDPAVTVTITRTAANTTTAATNTLVAAITGDVTLGSYTLAADLQLSGGSAGATVTLQLKGVSGTASLDLSSLTGALGLPASDTTGLPTVSLTGLELTGSASTTTGEAVDLVASTAVSLPGSTSAVSSTLLLDVHAGGSSSTTVLAGFELASTSLSQILPSGDVPAGGDFSLPNVALLVADPATTLQWSSLSTAEQSFFKPFCGATSSACHTSLSVPSGVSMVSAFPLPSAMSQVLGYLAIPVPSGDVLITGTVPVFGSGSLNLTVALPAIAPSASTPDFFHSGQLNFTMSLTGSVPSMSLVGSATFNVPKGSLPQSSCTADGGVWRTPRQGSTAACYDQVPFQLSVAVQLSPVSLTFTGGLAPGYTWTDPLGATWLTLNQAAIQLGITSTPTPGGTLGFLIGATIGNQQFTGAIDASVEVGPTGLDPNILGFRIASGTGLSMQDIVDLGNLATGSNIQLDSTKIPNLAVRNILLSYSETNDPALCLPLGLHIAGDLYLDPSSSALTVAASSGCSGGAPTVNRAALCQKDTANGCLAGVDMKLSSDGITASGAIGAFTAGPLSFNGAEVDLALTSSTQHLVIAGGLSVPNFLSGSADLLVSPTQLQFRGSADVFNSGLQAYLEGQAAVDVTSLKAINNVGSFNVTAVLQTTFLHQSAVAIAAPLEKLRPVLQILDTMLTDLGNGNVLAAVTALPGDLANLGQSLPAPYGGAFTTIRNGLATMNSSLSAHGQGSANLDMVLNGTTISVPGTPGKVTPATCIGTWVNGTCYTTPPQSTLLGTIPGIPGVVFPATCWVTWVNGTCYVTPPINLTIPGICKALQGEISSLDCTPSGIFNGLVGPVLKSVIQSLTGYSVGNLSSFLADVNNALTSNDIFDLTCAEFQASAVLNTAPSASVSLSAAGDVLSYPFNAGLSWNFAPNSSNVGADVATLLGDLVNPATTSGTCGLPSDWNNNPDFPGIGGSVTSPNGGGSSGGSGTATTPPPPALTVSLTSSSITEGSSATVTGSVTPAPTSPEQISVTWGDGTPAETVTTTAQGAFTASHAFPDISPSASPSAQYLVTVDDSSENLTANANLTVTEATPTALTVSGPLSATPTGTAVNLTGSFTDPASEPHVVTAVWGDGSTSFLTVPAHSTSFTGLTHTYLEEPEGGGAYQVQVTVTDDGTASSTAVAVPVTVADSPPSNISVVPLDAAGAPCPTCQMTTAEQQLVNFQVSFSYVGTTDPLTAQISFGDGTPAEVIPLGSSMRSFDISHLWTEADPPSHPGGHFPITVTITDGDGSSATATPALVETVTNVAPSNLSACLPSTGSSSACPTTITVPVGTTVNLFGGFSDPSSMDTHTVAIDWGPGWPGATRVQTLTLPVGVFSYSASRIFDDEGTYPVTVTVTDDDGASVTTTSTVQVTSVPPQVSIATTGQTLVQGVPAYLTTAGTTVGLGASASDPSNDALGLLWSFGDGSSASAVLPAGASPADQVAPENPTNSPVSGTDPVAHTWSTACLYNVGFSAADGDGGSGAASTDAVVTGNSPMAWQAGYWLSLYRRGLDPALSCDMQIAARMSAIFNGPSSVVPGAPVPLVTASDAVAVLQPRSNDPKLMLEREILTMWLDYADGAFTYAAQVHPSGSPSGYDPTFGALMNSAEEVALNPASTSSELRQMRKYLDGLIGG
ncbi:MAG: hypothetical protein ACYCSF_06240 [Acidimicrobiales bacterium]